MPMPGSSGEGNASAVTTHLQWTPSWIRTNATGSVLEIKASIVAPCGE